VDILEKIAIYVLTGLVCVVLIPFAVIVIGFYGGFELGYILAGDVLSR
jgi:hypothetical protein